MGGISIWQIIIILLVIALVFGMGKLPGIGRDLGKALREFRSSFEGKDKGAGNTVRKKKRGSKANKSK